MKVLCALTQYNYGSEARGVSIEYASFLPALRSMGHEVIHFETWDSSQYPTYADLNRGLLLSVETNRPDVVFTVQRDYELWIETLQTIATRHRIPLVTWITDDSFKFRHYSRFIGPCYDGIGTTYDYRLKDYEAAGIHNAFYTQWAANEDWLQPPKAAHECNHQISFIGTNYGDRAKWIQSLRDDGLDVSCFGHGWPGGAIATERIPEIMRDSVISLNFSGGFRSDGLHDRQLKARTFEVPGAGGFLLSEHAPSIESFCKLGEEVAVFQNLVELRQRAAFYLSHPAERDRVAEAGYKRTCEEHLYSSRLRQLFDFACQQQSHRDQGPTPKNGRSPLPHSNIPSKPLVLGERIYRATLTAVCRMLFGSTRGLKAARRFTFEASVRLLGSRTFTSKSLPGRLFPYV